MPVSPERPSASRRPVARFLRRDEGSFAVFSLFVFVAMLLVAGLAIDLMRHENVRLRMQGLTDRAVLAATMLRDNPSNATPEQILNAYFAAEGMQEQLAGRYSIVEDEETGRTITVVPSATVPSLFMRMIGINDFAVATPAQATEAVGGGARLELVMVLDVSGSMAGTKIAAMRQAAADLANTLLADNSDGRVAVTLVPYDTWVLPPAGFLNNFTNISGSGACNDWTNWNTLTNTLSLSTTRRSCNTADWRTVRPYLHDAATAVGHINSLVASDTTSIDLGARWGAMFFDPSIRPALASLITAGSVSPVFANRPFDWNEPNVVRAMLLLTDGENCCGSRYSNAQQDLNTIAVCTELKARNVLIYSVAFQAPSGGVALMQNCASSPSHYFNASVAEILTVFQAIGASVQTQALRLTQ